MQFTRAKSTLSWIWVHLKPINRFFIPGVGHPDPSPLIVGWVTLGLTFMGGEETQRLLGEIRNPSERTMINLTRYFERQIELGHLQAESPQEMAIAFTGILMSFGFIAPLTYGQTIDDPEKTARFVVRLFLDGMSKD